MLSNKKVKLTKDERTELNRRFIKNLVKANVKDLAHLKRTTALSIYNASEKTIDAFYRYLPEELRFSLNKDVYFLVSTLFAINISEPITENFAFTMKFALKKNQFKSIKKVFCSLCKSEFSVRNKYEQGGGELARVLKKCVILASKSNVGINWELFLENLLYWSHPSKFVQTIWLHDFLS